MSNVAPLGSANVQMMQAIAQLNQIVGEAVLRQAELTTDLVAISLGQAMQDQQTRVAVSLLDKVV
jgi:hypothetical protein